ncbi:MAG: hypothetical protein ACE15F_23700 [bacterium]
MVEQERIMEWMERMADGETEIPPEIREFLMDSPEWREYAGMAELVASALETVQIPEPPLTLTDDVMRYLAEREPPAPSPVLPSAPAFGQRVWEGIRDWVAGFHMPLVLQREAWPTALATIVVILGVLASPKGEAFNLPIATQVSKLAGRVIDQSEKFSEQFSGRMYSLASGVIGRVTMEIQNQLEKAPPPGASEKPIPLNDPIKSKNQ